MFREDKTTQMAARLLTLADGRLPYIHLMKMLYIADKQMLVQWGKPIAYDRWYFLRHGPVLGATLDLIKSEASPPTCWSAHIATDGYDVVLVADPGDDDLSRAEDAVILQTFREWAHKDWRDVVKETHGFPEWSDPGHTLRPVSYDTVLAVSGFSQEDADDILENIEIQDEVWGLELVA